MKIQEEKKAITLTPWALIDAGDVFRYKDGLYLKLSNGKLSQAFVLKPGSPDGTPANAHTRFGDDSFEVVDATLVVR